MAVDYAALKKGGFMRQKQKNNFSLRLQVETLQQKIL
jgi:anaerobic sulfite reductase subunit C